MKFNKKLTWIQNKLLNEISWATKTRTSKTRLVDNSVWFFATENYLAERLRCSERAIRMASRFLRQEKLIDVAKLNANKNNRTNYYKISGKYLD